MIYGQVGLLAYSSLLTNAKCALIQGLAYAHIIGRIACRFSSLYTLLVIVRGTTPENYTDLCVYL